MYYIIIKIITVRWGPMGVHEQIIKMFNENWTSGEIISWTYFGHLSNKVYILGHILACWTESGDFCHCEMMLLEQFMLAMPARWADIVRQSESLWSVAVLWIIANRRGIISGIRKIGQPYCIKKLNWNCVFHLEICTYLGKIWNRRSGFLQKPKKI